MKAPLILLPGLLCDEELWRHQIKVLKSVADCQVPDLTRFDNMSMLAQGVLATAPPQFALAGLSMGGYVAFEIMRQAPERVTKLCLLDTSARPDTPEQTEKRQALINMCQVGQFKGVTPRLLPLLLNATRLKDKELTDAIFGMAGRIGRDGFVRQQTAIMNRDDSRPHLSSIHSPTQIICGHQDMLTPPDIAREIAAGIKGARMDIVEDCGHLSPLEQPERVSAIMKGWLAANA
jgi:pimeloyl-ACP methyl ester carboxylesterase